MCSQIVLVPAGANIERSELEDFGDLDANVVDGAISGNADDRRVFEMDSVSSVLPSPRISFVRPLNSSSGGTQVVSSCQIRLAEGWRGLAANSLDERERASRAALRFSKRAILSAEESESREALLSERAISAVCRYMLLRELGRVGGRTSTNTRTEPEQNDVRALEGRSTLRSFCEGVSLWKGINLPVKEGDGSVSWAVVEVEEDVV